MRRYSAAFYDLRKRKSRRSARAVLPWVMELVAPRSVVDVGCGTGTWLSICREELGLTDLRGVEGPWVRPESLEIGAGDFAAHDLTRPWQPGRTWDLVVSLEVAEHLPASAAETFVDTLTSLGDVVLFSAAIPRQGGLHHHNEQWQSYWMQQFERRGFRAVDCVRGRFWNDPHVAYWYAQNAFFYVREQRIADYPALLQAERQYSLGRMDLVHPRHYLRRIQYASLVDWMRGMPLALVRSIGGQQSEPGA